MKQPLKYCINGDSHPVQPPSYVLCKQCLAVLDKDIHALASDGESRHPLHDHTRRTRRGEHEKEGGA